MFTDLKQIINYFIIFYFKFSQLQIFFVQYQPFFLVNSLFKVGLSEIRVRDSGWISTWVFFFVQQLSYFQCFFNFKFQMDAVGWLFEKNGQMAYGKFSN
eukprot:TRINITY_DN9821_c2_g1_i1.p2 TRINITY_DN9821_c2_g1~~TRINITY_DN9821_c2_g1_i1.p2  ORF type:complete len:110 (+),score=6.49 TRINITY_DN9821_c2_g1_i1:34-330(+)